MCIPSWPQFTHLLMTASSMIMHYDTKKRSSRTGLINVNEYNEYFSVPSSVSKSESNRKPLECGKPGDLQNRSEPERSASVMLSFQHGVEFQSNLECMMNRGYFMSKENYELN